MQARFLLAPFFQARIFALLLAIYAQLSFAQVTATVDRNAIFGDETLTFTVKVTDTRGVDRPDFDKVSEFFEILGTSQQSNTMLTGTTLERSTQWVLTLAPKQTGSLRIPPLEVGKWKTEPITIEVKTRNKQQSGAGLEDVFIEAELSANTVYVMQQTLLTVRVNYTGELGRNSKLDKPDIERAGLRKIAENEYQRIEVGKRYRVIEQVYAFFPSDPGELVIPPLTLHANLLSGRPRSLFDPMFGNSRSYIKRTEPLTLNVIERPEGISQSSWLPASRVSLEQSFSQDIQQLKVGDSITRSIRLSAVGIAAAQLPPLSDATIDGLKFYPDQPQIKDNESALGIVGQRIEQTAIIATRPGRFTLPEQRIRWWDVQSNQAQEAVLPAVSFEVIATPGSTQEETPQATPQPELPTPTVVNVAKPWYLVWQWWLICLLLLALLVAQHILLKRLLSKAQPGINQRQAKTNPGKALKAACDSDDAKSAYPLLLRWCKNYWEGQPVNSLSQLEKLGACKELCQQALLLEQHLYSAKSGQWQGKALYQAVEHQAGLKQPPQASHGLPPLYPDSGQ